MAAGSNGRRLIFVVVALVAFVALYQLLQPAPADRHDHREKKRERSLVFTLLPFAVGGAAYAWAVWRKRRVRRAIAVALEHMDRGELAIAESMFLEIGRGSFSQARASAESNAAITRLRAGEVEHAIAVWERARAERKVPGASMAHLADNLALGYAVRGQLRRARELAMQGPSVPTCADLVIAVMSGQTEDLPAPSVEPGTHGARTDALMRGLAAAARNDRDAALELIERARPRYSGEFDYLASEWPVLSNLLAADPWRDRPVSELPAIGLDELAALAANDAHEPIAGDRSDAEPGKLPSARVVRK